MQLKLVILLFFGVLLNIFLISAASRERRATGCAAIQIVSRKSWGVNKAPVGVKLNVPVDYVFFHHTEGATCNSQATCSNIVKGIYNHHKNNKKWKDVGYSFLIGGDGRVYEGRGWDKVGTHTYGWNSKAVAFSFIGNFTSKIPSSTMQNTAKKLLLCGIAKRKISSNYGLYGHRDGSCTTCPGEVFYNALKSWSKWHKHGRIKKFCSG